MSEPLKPTPTANLHTGDKALLKAAQTGEGLVEINRDSLDDILKGITARMKDVEERYPKLVEECPYETRLAVTAWVMKHIVEHAVEGGSYRYLIYERLGFNPDAYVPLCGNGLIISNEFSLDNSDERYRAQPTADSSGTDTGDGDKS